ncbi:SDR family NAD(P)-dependent oxidoreductase [Nocardioides bizhenqiangii]|uniref:SDR family NAD(P)-dependent oxidoreductase n=1 Tax=Nocardioides bizhenqiangii TaxID=3095076 RepID=A0ABZ0ZVS9_9ACTN|nr:MULTISPECIES: SDR family NAD(P)-dependent oxidoreductase [unclassified Nocardioides]MDZ5622413.1 SDR family NAD(P)-dependent oxidoreductase [Nocardioides sp. HM23]WQQ28419.1 SDR family NAD(P)-dependent oxidoreductase [Nocardioides sp. HM61]
MNHTAARPPLALVTGASTGIGRALARQFAEHGYDVVVAADEPEIERTADEIAAVSGQLVTPVQVDLSTADGVQRLYEAATGSDRALDAVALNVGTGVHGRFDTTDLDEDLRLVDLNCRSTVHLAKLVVRDMVTRGEGRVLVTASIAARAPGPFHATYAASKAFVHSFAEAVRHELDGTGVTVTSLMPGPTDTAFFERAHYEDTQVATGPKDSPDQVAADGFAALMAGRAHVVPGSLRNKVMAAGSALVPDALAAKVAARQTKPGSA